MKLIDHHDGHQAVSIHHERRAYNFQFSKKNQSYLYTPLEHMHAFGLAGVFGGVLARRSLNLICLVGLMVYVKKTLYQLHNTNMPPPGTHPRNSISCPSGTCHDKWPHLSTCGRHRGVHRQLYVTMMCKPLQAITRLAVIHFRVALTSGTYG